MDAGKLDTRIEVKSLTKTPDGFGGTSSSISVTDTIWANVREKSGDIDTDGLDRGRKKQIVVIVRSKTVTGKSITEDNVLSIENESGDYRIVSIKEHTYKQYIKIEAVRSF